MDRVQKAVSETFAGLERPKLSEWADNNRVLTTKTGAFAGPWRTDRNPVMREIMDCYNDPLVETLCLMTCAQIGKSELLNNVFGWHATQDPCPILMVQPTIDAGRAYVKERLNPMISSCAALRRLIPRTKRIDKAKRKARDLGLVDTDDDDATSTVAYKPFPGGYLAVVGANSPVGLASRPIRVVLFDEVDRTPHSAKKEGDPVALAWRRTATFPNRKRVVSSTPTEKGSSRIEALFESSDKRFFQVPCAHCGTYQRLVWSQVRWPKGRPREAHYCCEHCGGTMTTAQKNKQIRLGYWKVTNLEGQYPGFHLSELYSPFKTLAEMVVEFLEARKSPETLRTWINTALGETYEEPGSKLEPAMLAARAEDWGLLPTPQVLVVTCGVDVQADRLEIERVGWGVDEESWSLDYKIIYGDPSAPTLWAELDAYLLTPSITADNRLLPVKATCIDSGGHNTDDVYKFVRSRAGRRVWAIKGVAGQGKPVWPLRASKNNKGKIPLFLVGVDSAKDAVYRRLATPAPGPGYCHFPLDRDAEYYAQLTAEKRVTEWVKGFPRRTYVKKDDDANEALDCRVYAYAALRSLAPNWHRELSMAHDAPRADLQPLLDKLAKVNELRREAKPLDVEAAAMTKAVDAAVAAHASRIDARTAKILGRRVRTPQREFDG